MNLLPAAILAGGLATRLGSLTIDTPKCLLDVAGRPFIHRFSSSNSAARG